MRILVIGSGAREHALLAKMEQSPLVNRLFIWPGNVVINSQYSLLNCSSNADWKAVAEAAKAENIDCVVVGPEKPLSEGFTDIATAMGLRVFGPQKVVAQLESSKIFAKEFMARAGIPTADFRICRASSAAVLQKEASAWLAERGAVVIKVSALAAGKGVFVCHKPSEVEEAVNTLYKYMPHIAGEVVLEDCLRGREVSYFTTLGRQKPLGLGFAVDFKRLNDGDKGPNTGGMGCYTPVPWLVADAEALVCERIITPLLRQLERECLQYTGFLYVGIMWTPSGPQVIEFNVRLGDPEAQVLTAADSRDWAALIDEQLGANRHSIQPIVATRAAVAVVVSSADYPYADPPSATNDLQMSLFASEPQTKVFAAAVKSNGSAVSSTSGRVLTVVGCDEQMQAARSAAYSRVKRIREQFIDSHCRSDIAAQTEVLT